MSNYFRGGLGGRCRLPDQKQVDSSLDSMRANLDFASTAQWESLGPARFPSLGAATRALDGRARRNAYKDAEGF